MTLTRLEIPGYRITELLYGGKRTLVYRGIREADQLPIVLKVLRSEFPSFSELVQFRNQYTIAKTLNLPGVIQPYSLEPQGNGYALVMEDFGGISLAKYQQNASQRGQILAPNLGPNLAPNLAPSLAPKVPLPIADFLSIALQITDILNGLYHHRVIHKDIKPANILINPATQQIKVIDFSIASLLPREIQQIQHPNILEGTLTYLSPEQTGRMNRGIDYRSDFYALGATFYELLVGHPPFQTQDPLELIHCHIAKQPDLVNHLNPEIPAVLADIVAKLMAKNAEDRYQSALGLQRDLQTCRHQWQQTGRIESFELTQDLCDRFLLPEKLYGRQAEVQMLLDAFDRVSQGSAELMLVAGFSGIGKTAIVHEVHQPISRQRGYFIQGKYDQFNRNIPFSALVQAFRDLLAQLLSESDAELNQWKTRILAALAGSAQVIVEVIPELEPMIGPQPSAPQLSGSAAQNRFNLLFQKFIQVFTTPDHPLVMFLDDLQWADSASLSLIQGLISQPEVGYLLLIGAYRDHEVSLADPLMLMLADLRRNQATLHTLTLAPLSLASLNQWVADTLHCAVEIAQPLTQWVAQKTQGNPFFATQFLKALHQDGWITFDRHLGHWQCDLTTVRQLSLTDDVVEFIVTQLEKLPAATQTVLKLAACIGNRFDLNTLAIVAQQSEIEVSALLWPASQAGLILPPRDIYQFVGAAPAAGAAPTNAATTLSYRFLHDRVQQAAYSLIPDRHRQINHLTIGRWLRQATPPDRLDQQIFAIVNHLNQGAALISEASEQQELVQLNLRAGRKAISATAYRAAADYAAVSWGLLPPACWEEQYDLTLTLHNLAAAAACLAGDFGAMAEWVDRVARQARTLLDRIEIDQIKIRAFAAQGNPLAAAEIALETMRLLGVDLCATPDAATTPAAFQAVAIAIGSRTAADLLDQPAMTDPHFLAALDIFGTAVGPVYIARPDIYPLFVLRAVELSVIHGHAPASCYVYGNYGVLLAGVVGDFPAAYGFGQLALQLFSSHDSLQFQARTLFAVNAFTLHWQLPLRTVLPLCQQIYLVGLETGDTLYAGYSINCYTFYACFAGQNLADLAQETEPYSQAIGKLNQQACHTYLQMGQQLIANLLVSTPTPYCLQGEHYNEPEMLPLHQTHNDYYGLATLLISKLVLAYLFQALPPAAEFAAAAEPLLPAVLAMPTVPVFYLYDSLTQLALWPTASAAQQQQMHDRVSSNQAKMKLWADHAPMNFLHKFHLVEAERARVLGDRIAAIEHYDQAIALANCHEYVNEAAIANERAAQFYLAWGKERIAQEYLIAAYYAYGRWGAAAKVWELEQRYPELLAPVLPQKQPLLRATETIFAVPSPTQPTSTSDRVSEALDLAAVLKGFQALSREIELNKLVFTLLEVVMESAGADKGALMLLQDQRLMLVALHPGATCVTLPASPVEDSQNVPFKLVNRVKHSLESSVIDNATDHPWLAADPYIQQNQPKSLLCMPLRHQSQLLGLLYLENNLAIGAFTLDRVELLNLLCTQAAIAIENAQLYAREQDKTQALQDSIDQLQQSETRFKELFEKSADAILLLGNQGFIDCNQSAIDLFEYTHKDQIRHLHPSRISPELQPDGQSSLHGANAMIAAALRKGNHQFEWRHTKSSGEEFWAEVMLTVIVYDGEQVLHSLVRDISDRKQAEQALKLTQFSIDHAYTPFWWVKPSGQVLYANEAACRDLGYSQAEILQRYIWDFDVDLEAENWPRHWQRIKQQGVAHFETRNRSQAGLIYPVEVVIHYIELDGEEYQCAIVNNISDRKQIEAMLQKQEQFLRSIYDGAEIALFVIDVLPDGSFCYAGWNTAAERVTGISSADVAGKTLIDILGEAQSRVVQQQFEALTQTGLPISYEECLTLNGQERWWFTSVKPLQDAQGRTDRLIGTSLDISDRKRVEFELNRRTVELEQTLQELQNTQTQMIQAEKMSGLGQLVAGVAHEINNPVNFISGNLSHADTYTQDLLRLLQLYQQCYPTPDAEIQAAAAAIDLPFLSEDLPKLLISMKIGADRIQKIVASLRIFSRMDEAEMKAVNIHDGLDSTLMILQHRLKAKPDFPSIDVIKVYADLPLIECYAGQLNQVFMNLLSNAIDALEESFSTRRVTVPTITIRTQLVNPRQVMIQVTDNGLGIPESIQPRLFDPFFTTKPVGKGTGIGLSISYQIVTEKHQGTLQCVSAPGEGTTFAVTIPIQQT